MTRTLKGSSGVEPFTSYNYNILCYMKCSTSLPPSIHKHTNTIMIDTPAQICPYAQSHRCCICVHMCTPTPTPMSIPTPHLRTCPSSAHHDGTCFPFRSLRPQGKWLLVGACTDNLRIQMKTDSQSDRQSVRQTDRQTDRQRQTDRRWQN